MQSQNPGMLIKGKEELKNFIKEQYKGYQTRYIVNDYTSSIIPNAGKFGYPLLLIGSNSDVMIDPKTLTEFFHNCKR